VLFLLELTRLMRGGGSRNWRNCCLLEFGYDFVHFCFPKYGILSGCSALSTVYTTPLKRSVVENAVYQRFKCGKKSGDMLCFVLF